MHENHSPYNAIGEFLPSHEDCAICAALESDRFAVMTIERTIEWADDGSEDYSDESVIEGIEGTDARGAIDALESGCWDLVDARSDGTIILYPADSQMNYRTGADESTQVIVYARRPEWADRVLALYGARMRARSERAPYGV